MTRSETTKFLSRLLEKSRFSGPGKYWAREVSLDYGYAAGKPRRIDPEKNVRIHSEQQIRELKRSLEKFGQTRALVVDENNVILIGNGLYEAMVSLGYQEASVYVKAHYY